MDPLALLGLAALGSVSAAFGLMVAWCGTLEAKRLWQAGGSLCVATLLLGLLILLG